jgi:hypothetical protein
MRRVFRHYGAGPLHLLSLLACFALVGYVVTRIHAEGGWFRIALWFVLALVAHDLILWPLYALADRSAIRLAHRRPEHLPRVPWINHVRVPAVISGVLLGMFFPLIFRVSDRYYSRVSGMSESPYLGHWLLVTGILFAGSAVIYAIRLGRARRPSERSEQWPID